MQQRRDVIQISANMTLRLLENTKVVDERRHHNVFLVSGRQWLTYLIGARAYPTFSTAATVVDVDLGDPSYSLQLNKGGGLYTTRRIRWIALGTGGTLQVYSPPGVGGYTEIPDIRGLENPVTVAPETTGLVGLPSPYWWMGEVDPQDITAPQALLDFPDVGTIVFRHLFTEDEISFASALGTSQDSQGNLYGTEVPITEAGLFTSGADPFTAPHKDKYAGQTVPGIICYGLNSPLVKTPKVALEAIWEISVA